MKKGLVIILLLLPLNMFAQRFSGGITGGMNVSQIEGDTQGGYRKAGLLGGAFVTTAFREKWGGMLEIRYSGKGSSVRIDEYSNRVLSLNYIEMPVMATFNAFDKIQAQMGVSIGYLFRQTQREDGVTEVIEYFDPYEVAASVGIDYRVLDHLSINFRFSFSMIPIQADFPGATSTQQLEASFNNVLSFAAYYRIGR